MVREDGCVVDVFLDEGVGCDYGKAGERWRFRGVRHFWCVKREIVVSRTNNRGVSRGEAWWRELSNARMWITVKVVTWLGAFRSDLGDFSRHKF